MMCTSLACLSPEFYCNPCEITQQHGEVLWIFLRVQVYISNTSMMSPSTPGKGKLIVPFMGWVHFPSCLSLLFLHSLHLPQLICPCHLCHLSKSLSWPTYSTAVIRAHCAGETLTSYSSPGTSLSHILGSKPIISCRHS